MAVDEAILEAVAVGTAPPTLRIYSWTGRWLSIGMAEPIGDVDLAAARAAGVRVVRRPSGGTAVLHDDQLAWSLTLPLGHPLATGDIVASYLAQSRITLDALGRVGAAARAAGLEEARAPLPDALLSIACFGGLAPHEVVAGDPPRKLVGWGQVRRRNVVMHHAVASLTFDREALASFLRTDRGRLADALARRVTSLAEAGASATAVRLADAVVEAHGAAGFDLVPGDLSAEERARADALLAEKYLSDGWTARR
jgi:lipoate-protein ligase A